MRGGGLVNVLRTLRLSTKPTPKTNEMEEWTITGTNTFLGTNWCAEVESVCVQWVSRICECMTVCDMPDIILGRSGRIRQSNLSTN